MWEKEHAFVDNLEEKLEVEFYNEVLDCMIQQTILTRDTVSATMLQHRKTRKADQQEPIIC